MTKRLVDSAPHQWEDPLSAFTAVARDAWAAVKGYYRLIDQPEDFEVTPEHIMAPHWARPQRLMQALHLHSTFAVNADGLPLGVVQAQFDAPQPRGEEVPSQEEKKSFRWIAGLRYTAAALAATLPNTRVVSVADGRRLFESPVRRRAADR